MVSRNCVVLSVILSAGLAPPAATAVDISFNRDVRPILSNRCLACHGPDHRKLQAGLRLDDPASATRPLDSGAVAIAPGQPDRSELIRRITSLDLNERMPPADFGAALTATEIETIRTWIEQGSRFQVHWSYVKPERPAVPVVESPPVGWPGNAIDVYVLAGMRPHGLEPSSEADRPALIRRVFLDLTGLPPTVAEAEAYLHSTDPRAFEQLVEDLLQRPSFGEHWARQWLDLARYADSAGYADDPSRTIWAWRDWVIGAFNRNLPFDQFTIEQLAGDLLPDPSEDQLVATAFHRNTLTNSEGGTNDEEFRNVAIVDRVNTTLAVWMGTTMACAQCHSHKYDPITQEDYFRVFAVLNQTQDADRRDEAPVLELSTAEQRHQKRELEQRIAALQAKAAPATVAPATVAASADELAVLQKQLAVLQKQLAEWKPFTTVPILREHPDSRRVTRLQYRGNYLDLGPEIAPGVPAAFHPLTADRPADRLALAHWLVDQENPLTARVLVNRLWETLFGRGLVLTSEEFGSQGELPTHPELLDWLATEVLQKGWNTREILRLIVTSATYRQSSVMTEQHRRADPGNRWLSRGPRVRLSAETVRDQALFVSGLLSHRMFGPPVNPPQPSLGLKAAFGSSTDWETSAGEDRYRRAIYTTWRRSNPYPSMATFDAPNRDVCTIRRNLTNTPLQSLVTLNDPVFVEAAQALARRVLQESTVLERQIAEAFHRCLLRAPATHEVALLKRLYLDAHARLQNQPDEAKHLATVPLGELSPEIPVFDAAAMTVVANVILNLDEMFLKR